MARGWNGFLGCLTRAIEGTQTALAGVIAKAHYWEKLRAVPLNDRQRLVINRLLEMPPGAGVSGLESDGGDQFFCGGGKSGKVRAVRRTWRGRATGSGSESPGSGSVRL
jgi:hypothetical protein